MVHRGQLSDCFNVTTGVRQRCFLSTFMFLPAMNWILRTTTQGSKNEIQWTLWLQLKDLGFTDDQALLSHSHEQMESKTTGLTTASKRAGQKINRGKSKVTRINAIKDNPVTVENEGLEEVDSFKYLGSIIDKQGGTDVDVIARIGRARVAFHLLKNIWTSNEIRTQKSYIFSMPI